MRQAEHGRGSDRRDGRAGGRIFPLSPSSKTKFLISLSFDLHAEQPILSLTDPLAASSALIPLPSGPAGGRQSGGHAAGISGRHKLQSFLRSPIPMQ